MNIKKVFLLILNLLILAVFISCKNNSMNNEYEELQSQDLEGFELLKELRTFESTHAEHFESKVDLANFYLFAGQLDEAYDYSVRAEKVIDNAAHNEVGKEAVIRMYGDRARLELIAGNLNVAMDYVDKAIDKDKKHNFPYELVKAQILYTQGYNLAALEIFDKEFKKNENWATPIDYKNYLIALRDEGRYIDACPILDKFLTFGQYEYKLGVFASDIYEMCGQYSKAISSTFLDYLYLENFSENPDSAAAKFYENLYNLNEELALKEYYSETINGIQSLGSYFETEYEPGQEIDFENGFFIDNYIQFVLKVINNDITGADLQQFLDLENYFITFPSYYWNVFRAINYLESNSPDLKENVELWEEIKRYKQSSLEKIISIGKNNNFINSARLSLGNLFGLSESESANLLILEEVYYILIDFMNDRDIYKLEPILKLLDLPDNEYTFDCLDLLKDRHNVLGLDYILGELLETASPRLKDRISYIIG